MPSIFDIRIQKLFLITIILKVGSSYLGWFLQMQWSLGFWIPLSIMAAYIILGLRRKDRDVSDEKFADSCYYLGFIFTITSIIFSLFDLPDIGTKIQDIAVRFGAAMVSTVAGLAVRVYLVSFNKDTSDAIRETEYSIIETSQKFREQLVLAYERLSDFQSQVENGAKGTVERVNIQVENLSKNHADKLAGFFEELTNKNQIAFSSALDEVNKASLRLSESVDGYSLGMRANLGSIEAKVTAFTDAVSGRLQATTFPDDYFVKQLEQPLNQLSSATNTVAGNILATATEIRGATTTLTGAVKKLQSKSESIEASMDAAMRLTAQQQSVLDASHSQIDTLYKLGVTLEGFTAILSSTAGGLDASNASAKALATRIDDVVLSDEAARKQFEGSFTKFVEQLNNNSLSTNVLSTRIVESITLAQTAAEKVGESSTVAAAIASTLAASASLTAVVIQRLDEIAAAGSEKAKASADIGVKGIAAVTKLDNTVEQFCAIVQEVSRMGKNGRYDSSNAVVLAETMQQSSAVAPTDINSIDEVPFGPIADTLSYGSQSVSPVPVTSALS